MILVFSMETFFLASEKINQFCNNNFYSHKKVFIIENKISCFSIKDINIASGITNNNLTDRQLYYTDIIIIIKR